MAVPSGGKKKVTVYSHGEIQQHIRDIDNKEGQDGLQEHQGEGKKSKIKQASMKGMMDKQGSGEGRFD